MRGSGNLDWTEEGEIGFRCACRRHIFMPGVNTMQLPQMQTQSGYQTHVNASRSALSFPFSLLPGSSFHLSLLVSTLLSVSRFHFLSSSPIYCNFVPELWLGHTHTHTLLSLCTSLAWICPKFSPYILNLSIPPPPHPACPLLHGSDRRSN